MFINYFCKKKKKTKTSKQQTKDLSSNSMEGCELNISN